MGGWLGQVKRRESVENRMPNSDQGRVPRRERESREKGDSVLRELWLTASPPSCHPPPPAAKPCDTKLLQIARSLLEATTSYCN